MPLIGCGQRRKLSLGSKAHMGYLFLGDGELDGRGIARMIFAGF